MKRISCQDRKGNRPCSMFRLNAHISHCIREQYRHRHKLGHFPFSEYLTCGSHKVHPCTILHCHNSTICIQYNMKQYQDSHIVLHPLCICISLTEDSHTVVNHLQSCPSSDTHRLLPKIHRHYVFPTFSALYRDYDVRLHQYISFHRHLSTGNHMYHRHFRQNDI